jgi:hypothetical protein
MKHCTRGFCTVYSSQDTKTGAGGGIPETFRHYKWNQVRGGKDRHHYMSGTWPIILSESDSSTHRVQLHTRTIYVAHLPK